MRTIFKCLIVDDDPSVRRYIAATLRSARLQWDLVEAPDGAHALALAAEHPDLDFMVVDYNMPGMNGIELLTRLLQSEAFRSVPIMLYTTETSRDLIEQARSLSRTIKWVIKPLKPDAFIRAVEGCLAAGQ